MSGMYTLYACLHRQSTTEKVVLVEESVYTCLHRVVGNLKHKVAKNVVKRVATREVFKQDGDHNCGKHNVSFVVANTTFHLSRQIQ